MKTPKMICIVQTTARPETATTLSVRIGFDHHKKPQFGTPGCESAVRPEKMYWTRLASESRTKLRKNSAGLRQNAPDSLRIFSDFKAAVVS
jgi:hypothetical protein